MYGPGDQVPARLRLSAPIHPTSCKMCTCSFLRIKRPGRGAGYPPTSSAGVPDALELYHLLPFVPAYACHGVTFTFARSKFTKKLLLVYVHFADVKTCGRLTPRLYEISQAPCDLVDLLIPALFS